jgi:HPt (histidine-containing phosphotransfer) domain-containing protein
MTTEHHADNTWGASEPPVVLPPLFDFDDLLRRCMDKRDFALMLLRKTQAKLPNQIGELHEHCQAGRFAEAAMLAHELKGGTSSIGAKRLADALAQLESAARAEDGERTPRLAESVREQWSDLSDHLTSFANE